MRRGARSSRGWTTPRRYPEALSEFEWRRHGTAKFDVGSGWNRMRELANDRVIREQRGKSGVNNPCSS